MAGTFYDTEEFNKPQHNNAFVYNFGDSFKVENDDISLLDNTDIYRDDLVCLESITVPEIAVTRNQTDQIGDCGTSNRIDRVGDNRGLVNSISAILEDDEAHCHKTEQKPNKKARNQLIVVSILCTLFMIAEIAGGLISGSLALITDATHLASDIAGFLISLCAIWVSKKPATSRMSFGFYRAEVLGALISILIIWIVTGVLCYLAVERLIHKDFEIKATEMLITASLGVGFNIIMGAVLHLGLCCSCEVPHAHLGACDHSHGSRDHTHNHSSDQNNEHSHSGHDHSEAINHSYDQNEEHSNNVHNHAQRHAHDDHNHELHNQILMENNNFTAELYPDNHSINKNDSNIHGEYSHNTAQDIIICDPEISEKAVKNINVRAAFIHVIGDLIQSIGVLIAAIIITIEPDYKIADPICTFLFSVLVLVTTITVLRDIVIVIMEAVPRHVSYSDIQRDLFNIEGVKAVHSLHIWALSLDKIAIAVHLAINKESDWNRTLKRATKVLKDRHHAFKSIVQVEIYQEQIMKTCVQCVGPKVK